MVEQIANRNPQSIDGITFRLVASTISSCEYGKTLKNQTRFGRFQPEGVSTQEWQRLLGLDVNNLGHMPMTAKITHFFTQYCKNPPKDWPGTLTEDAIFSEREEGLLVLAANVHDLGEAIVGDIPSHIKTAQDHEDEMAILKKQMQELFGNNGVYSAISEAMDKVIIPRDTKLARAFHAIEGIGFLRVAVRAWERKDRVDPVTREALASLAKSVVSREIPRQEPLLAIYPASFEFLNRERNKRVIGEIIASSQ